MDDKSIQKLDDDSSDDYRRSYKASFQKGGTRPESIRFFFLIVCFAYGWENFVHASLGGTYHWELVSLF